MPQLVGNFTMHFGKFFAFTLEEKRLAFHCVILLNSILYFSQTVAVCWVLNESFSRYKSLLCTAEHYGVQTTLLFHWLPSGSDPSQNNHRIVIFSPLCYSTRCCAWTYAEVWASRSLAQHKLEKTLWCELVWTRRWRMVQRKAAFLEGRPYKGREKKILFKMFIFWWRTCT